MIFQDKIVFMMKLKVCLLFNIILKLSQKTRSSCNPPKWDEKNYTLVLNLFHWGKTTKVSKLDQST